MSLTVTCDHPTCGETANVEAIALGRGSLHAQLPAGWTREVAADGQGRVYQCPGHAITQRADR